MFEYPMARRTGKTRSIVEQVNWCALFNKLPICIMVRNQVLRKTMEEQLANLGLTQDERNMIKIIVTGLSSHPDAMSINTIIGQMRGNRFQRIYIDDADELSQEFVDRLREEYDNIMYVYGTPFVPQPDTDSSYMLRRFKFAAT